MVDAVAPPLPADVDELISARNGNRRKAKA